MQETFMVLQERIPLKTIYIWFYLEPLKVPVAEENFKVQLRTFYSESIGI